MIQERKIGKHVYWIVEQRGCTKEIPEGYKLSSDEMSKERFNCTFTGKYLCRYSIENLICVNDKGSRVIVKQIPENKEAILRRRMQG